EAQTILGKDSLFSKSLSYVNLLKFLNMSLHDNDSSFYRIPNKRELLILKGYMDNFNFNGVNNSRISLKDLIDTTSKNIRIRAQMKDLGSYIVAQKVDSLKEKIDHIFNPHQEKLESYLVEFEKGKKIYFDSLMENATIANDFIANIAKDNAQMLQELEVNPDKIYNYRNARQSLPILKEIVQKQRLHVTLTGISVVVSEGTKYLVSNLLQTLVFTILLIAFIIFVLFRSFSVNVAPMIPNIVPLIITAGLMGFLGIPLKPSTLIIFGIAIGITVNDAILLLAKLKTEIKLFPHLSRSELLTKALEDSGLGMAYTSIVLFFGFILFTLSQFGGTQALGLLISITILTGMFTNLILLPCLLLSFQKSWEKQQITGSEDDVL
ncbi:MAG: efflux RND transporter permease subunit, partial [Bacteroidota bacterium]